MQLDSKAKLLIQKLQYLITNNKVDIKKLFETLDKSGDNVLDLKEFRRLVNCLDPKLGQDAVEHIFKKFDTNGDNQISLEEFNQLIMETDYSSYEMNKDPFLETKAQKVINMMKFMINTYQIDLKKLLLTFDKQQKNELNFKEFNDMITKMNQIFAKKSGELVKSQMDYNISEIEMQYLFCKLDEDSNGSISQDELEKALDIQNKDVKVQYLIKRKSKEPSADALLDQKALKIISEIKHIILINSMNIQRIFKNFDVKDQGSLSLQEFTKLIKIIDETISNDEIEYIFKLFDTNNDKYISLEEFEKYIK